MCRGGGLAQLAATLPCPAAPCRCVRACRQRARHAGRAGEQRQSVGHFRGVWQRGECWAVLAVLWLLRELGEQGLTPDRAVPLPGGRPSSWASRGCQPSPARASPLATILNQHMPPLAWRLPADLCLCLLHDREWRCPPPPEPGCCAGPGTGRLAARDVRRGLPGASMLCHAACCPPIPQPHTQAHTQAHIHSQYTHHDPELTAAD